jgi:hypothetical protein
MALKATTGRKRGSGGLDYIAAATAEKLVRIRMMLRAPPDAVKRPHAWKNSVAEY